MRKYIYIYLALEGLKWVARHVYNVDVSGCIVPAAGNGSVGGGVN